MAVEARGVEGSHADQPGGKGGTKFFHSREVGPLGVIGQRIRIGHAVESVLS